jgi:tetratricopeptide (TPR) repeat protein
MIVDNADDPSMFSRRSDGRKGVDDGVAGSKPVALLDSLPQSQNGSILITSRSREAAFRLTGTYTDIIRVQPMDQKDALSLLHNKLEGDFDQNDAAALVKALDYMPLAISQAAAYISQRAPRATVSRYLNVIRKGDQERARLLDIEIEDPRRDGSASNSIMATWQISFEHIRTVRPSATQLLSLMSLFDRQGIPESLLVGNYHHNEVASSDFEDDVNILMSFDLVMADVNGSQFSMHRLVQFSTKTWLELYDELERWKERYATLMDENYPVGRYENWTVCQALFPHAQAAVGCQPKDTKALQAWASVLFKASWYASGMGQYEIAHSMGSTSFSVMESILGAEHTYTLDSLNNLGQVFCQQGNYYNAEAIQQRALETTRRVLGEDDPLTLACIGNLASTYSDQGRWKEAEELQLQVMEISNKTIGVNHPDTLACIRHLASTYRNQGRWKEAEDLGVQVMEMSKKTLGVNHPDTLACIGNLASTYSDQGQWKEAEELQVQVMEISKKTLGLNHPDTITSMANLALTWKRQSRNVEAIDLVTECAQLRYHILGVSHPLYLSSSQALATWEAVRADVHVST